MRLGVFFVVLAVPLAVSACVSGSSDEQQATPLPADDGQNVRVFDTEALEGDNGVRKILVEEYRVREVESVSCPEDQEVKQGNEFECTVTLGGYEPRDVTVTITVTDEENAEYQVSLPG